jgi:hypothetical protein
LEKSTPENAVEEEEEEEEEEDYDNEEEEDVQSFVTAVENENDHITESINDLHLGHDDDGELFNISLNYFFWYLLKVGLLHRMLKVSNRKL